MGTGGQRAGQNLGLVVTPLSLGGAMGRYPGDKDSVTRSDRQYVVGEGRPRQIGHHPPERRQPTELELSHHPPRGSLMAKRASRTRVLKVLAHALRTATGDQRQRSGLSTAGAAVRPHLDQCPPTRGAEVRLKVAAADAAGGEQHREYGLGHGLVPPVRHVDKTLRQAAFTVAVQESDRRLSVQGPTRSVSARRPRRSPSTQEAIANGTAPVRAPHAHPPPGRTRRR